MGKEGTLVLVSLLHAAFLGALVLALGFAGLPVRGALLGGGVMALSLGLVWGIARALISGRGRALVPLLVLAKVSLYLGLATAILTERLVADGAGFAAGVGCFLVATVAVALLAPPAWRPNETVS